MASEHSEQQKTRLEEEVKELMKKVQEMEGVRHRKDLDATSKASELEGKVRFLFFILFLFFFPFLFSVYSVKNCTYYLYVLQVNGSPCYALSFRLATKELEGAQSRHFELF